MKYLISILTIFLVLSFGNIVSANDDFVKGAIIGGVFGYLINNDYDSYRYNDYYRHDRRNHNKRNHYYHRNSRNNHVIKTCKDVIVLRRINGRVIRVIEKRCYYQTY